MSKKNNINKKVFLLVIILFVLLLIVLLKNINSKSNNNTVKNEVTNVSALADTEIIEQVKDSSELERIKKMNERTRIEYYVANYIKLIEKKDYDKAYSLLYIDYRDNYFKTQEEFEDYCKEVFSGMFDIQYDNFERNGDIYVVWITITDTINGKKGSGKELNFVIKENDFNDYELSFSKI